MHANKSRLVPATLAAALIISSSASGAAAMPPPKQTVQDPRPAWLALSMLTPSGTIGLGGAAVQPPPPPESLPPPSTTGNGITGVPIPVIAIWLAELAVVVYILTKSHHGHFTIPRPGSPA